MSYSKLLLFLLGFFLFTPLALGASFSTIGIGQLSNATSVCALVPVGLTGTSELYCKSLTSLSELTYPAGTGTGSYSAIAAGDDFLCGLTIPAYEYYNATMLWWDLADAADVAADQWSESKDTGKRVYWGPPLAALASGDTHVCGLIGREKKPYCWRWDVLEGLPPSVNFSEIAVGRDFVCGLARHGVISCFGNETSVVGKEPSGANFSMISAGVRHACGVSVDGQMTCWGVGRPEQSDIQLNSVAEMALGENTTCVLVPNGTVTCWGNGSQPPEHLVGEQFVSIHAQGGYICGILLMNYSLVCWGSNSLLRQNKTVYSRVLPGSCSPVSSCGCSVLPGSGQFCPSGEGICQSCKLQFNPGPPPYDQRKQRSWKLRNILIIIGSVGFVVGLTSLLIFLGLLIKRKNSGGGLCGGFGWLGRGRRQPSAMQLVNVEMSPSTQMNYNIILEEFPLEMLLKITDGFSETHKIGSGGFGVVYRAKLPDGREVAIKRANHPAVPSTSSRYDQHRRREKDQQREFSSELALLSRINHKNLVRLIGFSQEPGERILVYEYMANGTLHDQLHHRQVIESSPVGTWSGRLRLALDAARGIEYLHAYAVPPVIHRDIKSSNILLDVEWTAKLSDFGLSLTSPENECGATAGTVGYIDPEYYRLQRLTAKSDVYSFGVVLLELVTGRKAVHKSGEGDDDGDGSATPKNVVEMAVPFIEADDIERVMNHRVVPPTKEELEAVAYVGYVAAECVKGEARNRPTMVEVVGALERAVAICSGGGRSNHGRTESGPSGLLPEPGGPGPSGLLSETVGPGSELAREEEAPDDRRQQ